MFFTSVCLPVFSSTRSLKKWGGDGAWPKKNRLGFCDQNHGFSIRITILDIPEFFKGFLFAIASLVDSQE